MQTTSKAKSDERRRAKTLAAADAATRKRYSEAGLVPYDPRIASSNRELEIQSLGATKRARVVDYPILIRTKEERHQYRIVAMMQFDELCHRAYVGDFPNPRFEPAVDQSNSVSGVSEMKMAGKHQLSELTRQIGPEYAAFLFHRIFERRTFVWMRDAGFGDERTIAAIFLRAVDACAYFYGLAKAPRAIQSHAARLGAMRA